MELPKERATQLLSLYEAGNAVFDYLKIERVSLILEVEQMPEVLGSPDIQSQEIAEAIKALNKRAKELLELQVRSLSETINQSLKSLKSLQIDDHSHEESLRLGAIREFSRVGRRLVSDSERGKVEEDGKVQDEDVDDVLRFED